jgi:hypothetical protein
MLQGSDGCKNLGVFFVMNNTSHFAMSFPEVYKKNFSPWNRRLREQPTPSCMGPKYSLTSNTDLLHNVFDVTTSNNSLE